MVSHIYRRFISAGFIIKNPIIQNLNVENPTIFNDALYKDKIRAEIALNSISDAVICTDIRGNIDYLNIAAEKITGWSREEAA